MNFKIFLLTGNLCVWYLPLRLLFIVIRNWLTRGKCFLMQAPLPISIWYNIFAKKQLSKGK
ncbi:hypothetical protein D920_00785 [Enterococcus faecalis 13-SD-W-01]|nr:hypothetical protein D920_00785 [Enterococcus faecalis 13-SD-W-01]